jgi:hypothetical protein
MFNDRPSNDTHTGGKRVSYSSKLIIIQRNQIVLVLVGQLRKLIPIEKRIKMFK